MRVSSSRYRTKNRFVVLHDGFGSRGRRMNFHIDNLRIVLELCQSSVKRVLTWWSRSGEQSLVDPTHENRVSWSMLVIVRTSRLGRRDCQKHQVSRCFLSTQCALSLPFFFFLQFRQWLLSSGGCFFFLALWILRCRAMCLRFVYPCGFDSLTQRFVPV